MIFTKSCRDINTYNNEIFAYLKFKDKSWCGELISYDPNENKIVLKFYETKNIKYINDSDKKIVLYNILLATYDLFKEGYSHCDLHIGNILILNDNTVKIIDFESVKKTTDADFFESQDVIGKTFKMDPGNGQMCIMKLHDRSISTIFNIKSIKDLKSLMKTIVS